MELYFHAGLNKAGSTYAQELMSFNYEKLLQSGIYYPNPKVVNSIARNSPGNALAFTKAIQAGQLKNATHFLQNHVTSAKKNNCSRLLLSNESLYHELVDHEKLAGFEAICKDTGITNIKVLLIFRDPVSHALSAYNHRAGSNQVPPFAQWVRNGLSYEGANYEKGKTGYEFWEEVTKFHNNLKAFENLGVEFAAYSSDVTDTIEKFCGIPLDRPPLTVSNVSLNCIEAELLRIMGGTRPKYVRELWRRLKELPRNQKAPDNYLRYKNQVAVHECSSEIAPVLAKLRELLDDDQFARAPVESPTALFDKQEEPYLLLSRSQLEVLMSLFDENPAEHNLFARIKKRISKGVPFSLRYRIKALLGRT